MNLVCLYRMHLQAAASDLSTRARYLQLQQSFRVQTQAKKQRQLVLSLTKPQRPQSRQTSLRRKAPTLALARRQPQPRTSPYLIKRVARVPQSPQVVLQASSRPHPRRLLRRKLRKHLRLRPRSRIKTMNLVQPRRLQTEKSRNQTTARPRHTLRQK